MNEERMYHVIRGPHVTEKAALQAENSNMQIFKVDITATKSEIKKSIEALFEVDVTKVRTIKVKGKTKTLVAVAGKETIGKKLTLRLLKGKVSALTKILNRWNE